MRTTVSLDDDVFASVRAQAQRESISFGEALSRLARKGIQAKSHTPVSVAQPKSRFALLPARAEIVTSEHVRAMMEQEGI